MMALGDRAHKTALFDQFARVGKALASGKRLELLDLLAQGERDVASLAAAADLGVTTASAHLQTLRQANLVTTRRDGTRILYSLAGRDVAGLFAQVRAIRSHLPDVEAAAWPTSAKRPAGRGNTAAAGETTTVTVLDVRPRGTAGHIPDAIGIPRRTRRPLVELPDNGQIVAYARRVLRARPRRRPAPARPAATPPAWKSGCSNGTWPTCPSPELTTFPVGCEGARRGWSATASRRRPATDCCSSTAASAWARSPNRRRGSTAGSCA
jgi:DNA-binding transcriptional ArsR family regulator